MGLILVDNTWEAYRKVQKNNTRRYNNLTKLQQKQLREKGYKNSGKANVKKSHNLLNKYYPEAQEQELHYYVAVTDKATNIVQYADSNWYIWSGLFARNTDASSLESYEAAAEVAEEVGMYAIEQNLPWKIEIQWETK